MPIGTVREALTRALTPVPEAWLAFHERYSGYEVHLGRELAVWGIVHRSPHWLDAREASVEQYSTGCYVVCADVHPSFEYRLDARGAFSSCGGGGPAESFDVKVERDAVVWEATSRGRSWVRDTEIARSSAPSDIEAALRAFGAEVVAEASDRYGTCWNGRDIIALVGRVPDGTSVLISADARAQFVASLERGT